MLKKSDNIVFSEEKPIHPIHERAGAEVCQGNVTAPVSLSCDNIFGWTLWTSPFVCAKLLLLPKTDLTAGLQVVSHRLNTKQKIEETRQQ